MAGKTEQGNNFSFLNQILTRRKALQAGGLALVQGAILPAEQDSLSYTLAEREKRLIGAGLGEYVDFYRGQDKLLNNFWAKGPFNDIFLLDTLHTIAYPNPRVAWNNEAEIKRLTEGWGEKEATAVADAHDKAESQQIAEAPKGETVEAQRVVFHALAQVFPAMLQAYPEDSAISFMDNGGAAGIYAILTSARGENSGVTAVHEGEHELEFFWQNIKPWVGLGKFTRYIAKYTECVYDAYYLLVSSPIDFAYKAKNGGPMLSLNLGYYEDPQEEIKAKLRRFSDIDGWEQKYIKPEELTFPDGAGLFVSEDQEYLYRWNRVAYHVGRTVYEVNHKLRQGVELSEDERLLVDQHGREMAKISQLAADEIAHFLVGPVQKTGGGLPKDEDPRPTGAYHRINERLQDERMLAFCPQGILSYTELASAFEYKLRSTKDLLISYGANVFAEITVGLEGEKVSLLKLPDTLFDRNSYYYVNFENLERVPGNSKGWVLKIPKEYELVANSVEFSHGEENQVMVMGATVGGRGVNIKIEQGRVTESGEVKSELAIKLVTNEPVELSYGIDRDVEPVIAPVSFSGDNAGNYNRRKLNTQNEAQALYTGRGGEFNIFYIGNGDEVGSLDEEMLLISITEGDNLLVVGTGDKRALLTEGTVGGKIGRNNSPFSLPEKLEESTTPGEYLLYYRPDDRELAFLQIGVRPESAKMLDVAVVRAKLSGDAGNFNTILVPQYWREQNRIDYLMVIGNGMFTVPLQSIKWVETRLR